MWGLLTSCRPLVVVQGSRAELNVALSLAAPRVGGGDDLHRLSHTRFTPVVAVCCVRSKTPKEAQENMEEESRRKMKAKFGLRQDIFKEFLAEFLGTFVLIVSIAPCHQLKLSL